MAKRKKSERKRVSAAAWTEFSKYIRTRDAILTTGTITEFICISCDRRVPLKGNDAGHFVSGRGDAVLFNEEVVHGQCGHCNRFKEGEYIPYEKAMRRLYGFKRTEELKLLKWQVMKYSVGQLVEFKEHYRQATKDLVLRWKEGEFELPKSTLRN